jgi:hypothetical protein
MPIKPWALGPKKSAGLFEEFGNVLDSRQQRKESLEDRLARDADRQQQREARTLEMALTQAQLDAARAPKPRKIIGEVTNPETGEVFNRFDDGTAEPVRIAGASPAPAMPGSHEGDDEMHGQQQAPAPAPSTLRIGAKKKDAVLRNVGDDVYDFTDPTKPVLVKKADKKADNGAGLTKQLQREKSLRDEYMADPHVKNAYGVAGAAAQIRAAAEHVDNPQGDLDIIYSVVKIRDPNSVVREGEIDLQKAARSLGTQVAAAWQKAKSGRMLTAAERASIVALVGVKEDALRDQIAPTQAEFGRQARQYGADSSFVAPSPFHGSGRKQPATPAPKAGVMPTLDPRTFKIGRP